MSSKTKKSMPKSQSNPNPSAAGALAVQVDVSKLPPGSRASMAALLEQEARSFDLGSTLADELVRGRWFPADNLEMREDAQGLTTAYATYQSRREASAKATLAYRSDLATAVAYRDLLLAGLTIAAKGSGETFQADRLQLSGTIKSGRKLGQWFEEVINKVETHKAALQDLLGEDPVALTLAARQKLMSALGTYLNGRVGLSELSKEHRAAKVKLAAKIAEQRDAAKFAFAGDEAMLEKFVPSWRVKRKRAQPTTPASLADPAEGAAKGSEAAATKAAGKATEAAAPKVTEAAALKAAAKATEATALKAAETSPEPAAKQ